MTITRTGPDSPRFQSLAFGFALGVQALSAAAFLAGFPGQTAEQPPVVDRPFPQQIAHRYPAVDEVPGANWALIDVGPTGTARFFGNGRWYLARQEKLEEIQAWRAPDPGMFVFGDATDNPVRVAVRWADVIQLLRGVDRHWIVTSSGVHAIVEGQSASLAWPAGQKIRQAALAPDGGLWVASDAGLFRQSTDRWTAVQVLDTQGRRWAAWDVRGIAFDSKGTAWVATPAGVAVGEGGGGAWRFVEGKDGLPYNDFTGVTIGPDGAVWFGTHLGAIRFDGKDWAYRQGLRWLPGDDIREIAVDGAGTVWLATSGGLGAIEHRPMTLAEKAELYEDEIERYIKRTEFGYTSEVALGVPGDRSQVARGDSDNDGLWTSMYGAGECFAYASTKQAPFGRRARQAFEALRFLQKVTQGGPHSPPVGYVARTIRPLADSDPNAGRLEADRAERARGDRLWKVYEPRWPKSADARWYWKSDTSSDELDGHYFFYARYFDLVADAAERERVREVVRDLTDHLLTHDFCLVDHDGQPTRWGVFRPANLNRDPNWWADRGLNSLSLLSYLAVAEHVTGDPKYAAASRDLIEHHGYAANVMNPKVQTGPGSGNQSDDEMAFMGFYNLLIYTQPGAWRERWLYAFHGYAALELPELNPFFNFCYAALGRGQGYANPWGDFQLDPWPGWLNDALATLREFPLDRANWAHQNSHRLDLVGLPPQQSIDLYSPRNRARGYRVNGRVLSVAERHFNHWNTDPWRLDYPGDGRELASGTVFLLPYYMGLYHGFIASVAP